MDKLTAIKALIDEALASAVCAIDAKRCGRACAVLGLTSGEAAGVAVILGLNRPEAVVESFKTGFFGARDVGGPV